MQEETVYVVIGPTQPSLEIACGIPLVPHAPYDAHSVQLMVNPAVTDYQEQPATPPGISVKQQMSWSPTADTQDLLFDLNGIAEHVIATAGHRYRIRLLKVDQVAVVEGGQGFPRFQFNVTKLD